MDKFSVCIFGDYNVHYICNYSYLDEEGDFFFDNIDKYYDCKGSDLLELIIRLISDRLFISFFCDSNSFFIEHFNPNDGTGADFTILIKKCES